MWLYVSRDEKMCGCENAEKPQSDGMSKHYIANFHVVVRYCWSQETWELLSKDVDLLSRANVESSSLHTHQAHMNIGDGTWRLEGSLHMLLILIEFPASSKLSYSSCLLFRSSWYFNPERFQHEIRFNYNFSSSIMSSSSKRTCPLCY